ncbi:MAG: hypothetical protein LBP22_01965 [Deltaproteobacteria bacterium]|jgi:hypothetical protein|nr:hypothetical protein [Deltaproteobacteria bacterium]
MASLSPESHILKEENPDSVTEADLVIGFLAKDNASTINSLVVKGSEGQETDYPGLKTVFILSDCHSADKTVETYFRTKSPLPKMAVVCPPEFDAEIYGFFNLLLTAQRLGAKTVIIESADTMTVKRTWIKRLIQPIIDGIADFTTPLYSRNAIDAPVTNLMVYPMIRLLFGRRLRQPILTDWAFNDRGLKTLLGYKKWPDFPGLLALELTVKVLAVTGGHRICQSIMTEGRYGMSNKEMDTPHIMLMFRQLASGLFDVMLKFKDNWLSVSRSRPTSVTGTDLKPDLFPSRYQVSLEELYGKIHLLLAEYESEWTGLLRPLPGDFYNYLKTAPLDTLEVSSQKWGLFLFHCAYIYEQLSEKDQQTFIEAITPAFLARFLTFQKETIGLPSGQIEAKVEDGAEQMEKMKKQYLSQGLSLSPPANL